MFDSLQGVIAHRGFSFIAPENTLLAFTQAKQSHCNWIECDLQISKDDRVVVFHDINLSRTSNGKGLLVEQPFSYLKKLDVGSWFAPAFVNLSMPTLEGLIIFLQENKMFANIELKTDDQHAARLVKQTLYLFEKHWPDFNKYILFSSFNLRSLQLLYEQNNKLNLGVLMDKWLDDYIQRTQAYHPVSYHLQENLLTKKRIQYLHDLSTQVFAYTVDDIQQAKQLYSLGVDALFTNRVDQIQIAYQQFLSDSA